MEPARSYLAFSRVTGAKTRINKVCRKDLRARVVPPSNPGPDVVPKSYPRTQTVSPCRLGPPFADVASAPELYPPFEIIWIVSPLRPKIWPRSGLSPPVTVKNSLSG